MPDRMEGTVADFFSGIGLVELALESSGWTTLFANDIDRRKFDLYASNLPTDRYRLGDVWDLQPDDVPTVDLAWASFPCIDVSLAGNRHGLDGRHSSAFWGFHSLVRGLASRRPRLVVVENVMGLLRHRRGEGLRAVVRALNALGYRCDAVAVDAIHFVPQSRPRLFVLAALDAPYDPVSLVPGGSAVRPPQLLEFMLTNSELTWGFFGFANPPARTKQLPDVVEQIAPDSTLWWDEPQTAHLISQMSARHLSRVRRLVEDAQTTFLTVYRRVRPGGCRAEVRFDGVAGCLRTAVGGSSRQILLKAGNNDLRARWMTPREYARLQGVPDSFRIDVRTNQALHGFGDAVCVPVVEWLAEKFINPLWSALGPRRASSRSSRGPVPEYRSDLASRREFPALSAHPGPTTYRAAPSASGDTA